MFCHSVREAFFAEFQKKFEDVKTKKFDDEADCFE